MQKALLIAVLAALTITPGIETHGTPQGPESIVRSGSVELNGQMSGIRRYRTAVVRDPRALVTMWKQHGQGKPPLVDFTRYSVAAVFAGEKSTGGYSVRYSRTRRAGRSAIVEFILESPSPDMMVTQALTYPWAVRILPKLPPLTTITLKRVRGAGE